LVSHIHEEELPPDEYYEQLGPELQKRFKGCDPALVEHVVALVAAFDTAAAFALSFGIAKFQLAQHQVKLVGELVGKDGRQPNPELVQAIKKWPPVKDLKDLQSFLGTMNYVKPHCGPAYARIMIPLRPLLRKDAVFPPNQEQVKAIDGLKELLVETHVLAVPDEAAAIKAASAWMLGEPPTGRPYEAGADTSKLAMGGVLGQCEKNDGKLRILLYWSAMLAPVQSQWHPFEQEFWGLLQFKREAIKHLGRIPLVLHTDHGTITRVEYLPLQRVEAKHFRWHAELTQGGSLLLYRAGSGAMHKLPDALSRNPPLRDELILARTSDWAMHRANIRGLGIANVRGIEAAIARGEFDAE